MILKLKFFIHKGTFISGKGSPVGGHYEGHSIFYVPGGFLRIDV